jgi:hypothetical protein
MVTKPMTNNKKLTKKNATTSIGNELVHFLGQKQINQNLLGYLLGGAQKQINQNPFITREEKLN